MNEPATSSRFAKVSRWIAIALLVTLPLSVLGIRLGILPVLPALAAFALSCLGAIALLIILLATALMPGRAHSRTRDMPTAALALIPALVSVFVFSGREDVPSIHNISTDVIDPPKFVAARAERGESANPLELTPEVIALHTEAYPDLKTLQSALSPEQALQQATRVAEELGWDIYATDSDAGRIEAVDTTFWFGFKDDIVIRIRPSATGSVIDLRSVSRVGQSDLGANANRIRNFIGNFGN